MAWAGPQRAVLGQGGITVENLCNALDTALVHAAQQLQPGHHLRSLLGLPADQDVVRLEVQAYSPDPTMHLIRQTH